MKKIVPVAAIVVLSVALVFLARWEPPTVALDLPAAGLAAPPTGGDFTLRSWRGPVDTRTLRGKVILVYFGYTACPDICPTNLALIANALKMLEPSERNAVRVLFVSVDPERDTLERLRQYAGYFHPAIIGVTGNPAQIAAVAKRYGAAYRHAPAGGSAMGYVVDHSAYTYVVDPRGRLAQTLDHAVPCEQIADAIRSALAAGEPAGSGRFSKNSNTEEAR